MPKFTCCPAAFLLCAGLIAPIAAAQTSDECGPGAPALVVGTVLNGSNDAATDSSPGDSPCGGTADVYARFTPAQTGLYQLGTCGSGFDTVLSVHTGCPAEPTNTVDCADDLPINTFCSAGTHHGTLNTLLTGGVEYTVRIASTDGSRGAWVLYASLLQTPPANDECASATEIGTGTFQGGFGLANGTDLTPCGQDDTTDIWYRFTAPATESYAFRVTDSVYPNYTGTVSLFQTCDGVALACDSSPNPQVVRQFTAGEQILVRVSGTTLSISNNNPILHVGVHVPPPPPPVNDTCEGAIALTAGVPVTTAAVSATNDRDIWCNDVDDGTIRGVWYTYTGQGNERVVFRVESYTTMRGSVFRGTCGSLRDVSCTVNSPQFSIEVLDGETVYVLVGTSAPAHTPASYTVTTTATALPSGCCVAGACSMLTKSQCQAQGGTWSRSPCAASPTSTVYSGGTALPGSVSNAGPTSSIITVPDSFVVGDLSVSVTLTHTALSDLWIRIQHGTTLATFSLLEGTQADLNGTYVFSDAGQMTLAAASRIAGAGGVIPPGTYRIAGDGNSESYLTRRYSGAPANGNWTLTVQDIVGTSPTIPVPDSGELTNWSLTLNPRAAVACPVPCRADFDGAGGVQVADIFAFLSAWFAQDPRADFDGAGGVQVADIFAFLSAWFAGC